MTTPSITVKKTIEIKPIELAVGIDIHNHGEIVKNHGNFAQRMLAKAPKWSVFDFIHDRIKRGVNDEVEQQIDARLKKEIEDKIYNELLSKLREEVPVKIKEQLKAEGIEATVTVSIN
jgi:hypothetical protein